jgi:hypothetical protein
MRARLDRIGFGLVAALAVIAPGAWGQPGSGSGSGSGTGTGVPSPTAQQIIDAIDAFYTTLAGACVGAGYPHCAPGDSLGKGLVCPRPPVRNGDDYPADAGVTKTAKNCPNTLAATMFGSVVGYLHADGASVLDIKISGKTESLVHIHTPDIEAPGNCENTFTDAVALLNIAVDFRSGAGGGNMVSGAGVGISAHVQRDNDPYCHSTSHPGGIQCKE